MPLPVNTNIQAVRDATFGQLGNRPYLSGQTPYRQTVVLKVDRENDGQGRRVLNLLKEEEPKPAFPWIILGLAFLLLRRK
jgi:hypothetical protein